jgi:hypothetical protein
MSCARSIGYQALCVTLLLFVTGVSPTAQAGELEQRFVNTLQRAERGDPAAMYSIGEMYELGMGTDSDRAKAMTWYRAAADKGHPEGAYQVGYAYYWGKAGLDRDRRQAHVWFLRAAEAGSLAAMPYLAKMYALGQGVPKDKDKAAVWSARAAAGPSKLHSQPPAPKVKRKEATPKEDSREPARQAKAAPAPVVATQAKPATEAVTKPSPSPAAPQRPQATARVATKPKAPTQRERRKQQMERLLASWWLKDGRPALYLPSDQTDCVTNEDTIHCQSRPRRASLLGRPYTYRFRSNMKGFNASGRFTLRYWPDITKILPVPPGAFGTGEDAAEPPTDEDIRLHVERPHEELSCEMFGNTHIECTDSRGGTQKFSRLDRSDT